MNARAKRMISTVLVGGMLMGSTAMPSFAAGLSATSVVGLEGQMSSTSLSLNLVGSSKVSFGNSQTTVDTFNGVPAYYKIGNHNSDATYSCAAYVKRYYSTIFGVGVSNLLAKKTPLCDRSGYELRAVDARSAKPGDVGYHTNSSGGGHWFIIKSVDGNGLTVIEQNYKTASATSVTINRVVSYSQNGLKVFRLYRNGVDMNGGSGSQPSGGSSNSNTPATTFSSYTSGSLEQLLFDAELYYALYPDLQAVFGKDSRRLEEHWKNCGINEGRLASVYFDPQYYLNTNPDVASVYGKTNYAGAYNHFVAFGFAEGRQGSPVFSVRQYVNQYSDLKKAFGTNWLAAAWHFRNNGIAEGRQSSVSFSVTDYANLNSDVKKAFSTNRDYIIHYLQFGKNEGRATIAKSTTYSASASSGSSKDYSGTWCIKTASNYVINVQYASTVSDQAKVVVDPWNNQSNEIFKIWKVGDYYRISPKHAPNLALNAMYGASAKAGQQLTLHTWANNDDASLWAIEEVSGGVRIRNKANPNLVLDVDHGHKTWTGTRINLWTQDTTGNQVFTMQRV